MQMQTQRHVHTSFIRNATEPFRHGNIVRGKTEEGSRSLSFLHEKILCSTTKAHARSSRYLINPLDRPGVRAWRGRHSLGARQTCMMRGHAWTKRLYPRPPGPFVVLYKLAAGCRCNQKNVIKFAGEAGKMAGISTYCRYCTVFRSRNTCT